MKHEKLTEEVIIFILTQSMEDLAQLTRYKIAEKFMVNENYLSRRFKKDTNISLFEYIESAQVHLAAELLRGRLDLCVGDVQKMVGIEKYQNFSKKFRKIFGIGPAQYREIFKKKN